MVHAILFIPGLSILLGLYGYLMRPPLWLPTPDAPTSDTPPEASIDAVIPALNEEETIASAIASLATQTHQPDTVIVVDDGSTDMTLEVIAEMQASVDLEIHFIRHEESGSKTKRLKEATRSSTADKLFVLDADTYLVSETYIEELLAAHALDDVGCSFGTVRPDSHSVRDDFSRRQLDPILPDDSRVREIMLEHADRSVMDRVRYQVTHRPVEQYRSVLYGIEQSFFKESQMRLIGTALFPAGCGVLYDRSALQSVFDDFEASLGDQLTNSEDVFLGFSLVDRGFANIQVSGVTMRTMEPSVVDLLRQTYLWSSSFLQSAYYYRSYSERLRSWTGDVTDGISPHPTPSPSGQRVVTDLDTGDHTNTEESDDTEMNSDPVRGDGGTSTRGTEKPAIGIYQPTHDDEPANGTDLLNTTEATEAESRPKRRRTLAAVVASQIVDGLFPTALFIVALLTVVGLLRVELLIGVIAVEFALFLLIAAIFARKRVTISSVFMSIPVRLFQFPVGIYVYTRVAFELLTGNRNWSK